MNKRGKKKSSSPVGGALLKVQNLRVATETQEILHGVDVEVAAGETVVLLGPNGAGKSTLASAVMGAPGLNAPDGKIIFDGLDITAEAVDERARRGMFMAWQAPVEVPGVSVAEVLASVERYSGSRSSRPSSRGSAAPARQQAARGPEYLQLIPTYTKALELSPFMLQRDLNVGLSGGEKKKMEILQMMALGPKLAILDETDSGLDVDAARVVSKAVREYQKETNLALLIVTHNARILQELTVDKVYVLVDGRVVKAGDGKLVEQIEKEGFKGMRLVRSEGDE